MNTDIKITEIDLPFLKQYLRVDYEDDDNLLNMCISASKSFIETRLNIKISSYETRDLIPTEFTIAALALIAHWYENREIQSEKVGETFEFMFTGILDPYRVWQVGG